MVLAVRLIKVWSKKDGWGEKFQRQVQPQKFIMKKASSVEPLEMMVQKGTLHKFKKIMDNPETVSQTFTTSGGIDVV